MPGPAKTARFAAVVKSAGEPATYLLWSDPRKDPKFQRALAANLVMTVHREMRGTHKDHGEVGYRPDRHAQFLLFPKSLRRFAGKRVVGIDYDLLAERTAAAAGTEPVIPVHAKPSPAVKPPSRPSAPARENKVVRFPGGTTAAAMPRRKPAEKLKPRPVAVASKLDSSVADEIRRALRELKSGRNVAAYARLNALLGRK